MATPARLSEIECPACQGRQWIIDNDSRGAFLAGGVDRGYPERVYRCGGCGREGTGWTVVRQGPAEFLLQPHTVYPMTRADFDRWVKILREHFPNNARLKELGTRFYPFTPEDAAAARATHEREHPVYKIRDQDGAGNDRPHWQDTQARVDIMRPGDTLTLFRRDGGVLELERSGSGDSFTCRATDARKSVVFAATEVDRESALAAMRCYLAGDVKKCAKILR
jgi:hypothetical protein